jgi:hypothetical protein
VEGEGLVQYAAAAGEPVAEFGVEAVEGVDEVLAAFVKPAPLDRVDVGVDADLAVDVVA